MKHPNPDMLLRIAQGDAYGMCCEYVTYHPEEPAYHEVRAFERYVPHQTYHQTLKPGMYTDDTQMSIAVAEVLVDGNPHTRKDFVNKFWECFKRDPRDGYSRAFQSILEASNSPEHMMTMIRPDSDKNGAAMRAVPIGVFRSPAMVKQVAEMQAKITHDTPRGILSAQAVALMSHFALWTDHPLSDLPGLLAQEDQAFSQFQKQWVGPVQGSDVGMKTAHAVCTLLSRENSLLGIMERIIDWGGDTDSVAAIAWGIASCRMKEPLPDFFETELDAGRKYGATFLKDLGRRLMEAHQ